MKNLFLDIQTELVYGALATAMKLPDPVLAELVRAARAAARMQERNDGGELLLRLDELEEYFGTGSPLSQALRRILLDARPGQLKSTIRGYLRNYVYDW